MGDILHALPAVTALRQAHPSWTIDWVVEPTWAPLLSADTSLTSPAAAQPLVNRLHFARMKAWGRDPLNFGNHGEFSAVRKALRADRYDAVVDFQGAVRSAFLGRVSGARRRIGESHPREWAARWLFTERVETRGVHVIEQDVEVAAAIAGDDLKPVQPMLPCDTGAETWADTLLAGSQTPVVLLNPGAGWGAKRWPVERYAVVARELAVRGYRVFANAGPGEQDIAEELQNLSDGVAQPVECGLGQLIALTRRAAFMIAGDTGPLHLACALGKPVVGIYGPTDPARNGPYGTRFKVLRSPESVRDHSRRAEPEAGLLTIKPAEVLAAVDEVLSEEAVR
jgi:heptosyltransferase-1